MVSGVALYPWFPGVRFGPPLPMVSGGRFAPGFRGWRFVFFGGDWRAVRALVSASSSLLMRRHSSDTTPCSVWRYVKRYLLGCRYSAVLLARPRWVTSTKPSATHSRMAGAIASLMQTPTPHLPRLSLTACIAHGSPSRRILFSMARLRAMHNPWARHSSSPV